jgi:hypothetical protein
LIYGITSNQPKPKALAYSLSAGSVSPKYQPIFMKPPPPPTSTENVMSEIKAEINNKRYLFNKSRQQSGNTNNGS